MFNLQSERARNLLIIGILSVIVAGIQVACCLLPHPWGVLAPALAIMPIALGAALRGPGGGAWLGCVFTVTVWLCGDADFFRTYYPTGTIVLLLLRGLILGLTAAGIYRGLCESGTARALRLSCLGCALCNTLLFLLGTLVFYGHAVDYLGGDGERFYFTISRLVGLQAPVEFLLAYIAGAIAGYVLSRDEEEGEYDEDSEYNKYNYNNKYNSEYDAYYNTPRRAQVSDDRAYNRQYSRSRYDDDAYSANSRINSHNSYRDRDNTRDNNRDRNNRGISRDTGHRY